MGQAHRHPTAQTHSRDSFMKPTFPRMGFPAQAPAQLELTSST